jgi:hypothetical protein
MQITARPECPCACHTLGGVKHMVACCDRAGASNGGSVPTNLAPVLSIVGGGRVDSTGAVKVAAATGALPSLTLPNHTSWSQLMKYGECPKKYEFSYLSGLEVPEVSGAALAGIAIHKIIETAELEGFWDKDTYLKGLGVAFATDLRERMEASNVPIRWGGRKSREFPNGEDFLWWTLNMGPRQLARYQGFRRALEANGFKTDSVFSEVSAGALVAVPGEVDNLLYVRAYLDMLLMADTEGNPWVIDYKTGTMAGNPMQLAWYSYFVREAGITPEAPAFGAMVKLRARDMSQGITTYDLSHWIDLVPDMIIEHRTAARAGVFPVRPSNFCSSCSWRSLCPYGSRLPTKDLPE